MLSGAFFQELAAFEAESGVDTEGLTWPERFKNFLKKDLHPGADGRLHGDQKHQSKLIDAELEYWNTTNKLIMRGIKSQLKVKDIPAERKKNDRLNLDFPFTLEKLKPLTETSLWARRLYASKMFNHIAETQLYAGRPEAAVAAYVTAFRFSDTIIEWFPGQSDEARIEAQSSAMRSFRTISTDSVAPATLRADAFVVLAHLHAVAQNSQVGLRDLRSAQELRPEDPLIHVQTAEALYDNDQNREAIAFLERAVELGSDNIDSTLYLRGHIFANMGGHNKEAATCMQEYLSKAEADEPKVHEAHYLLACLEIKAGNLGSARRSFDQGVAAEAVLLPCEAESLRRAKYKSPWGEIAEARLKGFKACGNDKCPHLGQQKCANCRDVAYCSRECQKIHWKVHKKLCSGLVASST